MLISTHRSYHEMKLAVRRRMRHQRADEKVLESLRTALNGALSSEKVYLTSVERSRVLQDLAREMLDEMLKKL